MYILMQLKNKTLAIIITMAFFVILCAITTLIATSFKSGYALLSVSLSILNFFGFLMLLKNSTIKKTIYFNVILILIAVIIIGAMFKIMHWPGSNILLIIGLFGIAITYFIRFIKKPNLYALDILKLLWLISSSIIALGVTLHLLSREMTYIPNAIMLITIIYFITTSLKNKSLLEK